MKIRFANDAISEFSDGNLHLKNDGEPIDVSAATGADLLSRKAMVDGEWVDVFEVVGLAGKEAKEANLADAFPEDFPHADKLVAAGFSHEAAILLSKEQLLEVEGIGPKSADEIVKFHTEK